MKGIIFTEFLEMVESRFGDDTADDILEQSRLASGGIYTSVGTYDHEELIELIGHLHKASGIAAADLVRAYGNYIFQHFINHYGVFFEGKQTAFDFLSSIEDHIHVEVLKLYPDAELPSFECERPDSSRMIMTYRSARPFADLAEGLIRACIDHYRQSITLVREDLNDDNTHARFTLTRSI